MYNNISTFNIAIAIMWFIFEYLFNRKKKVVLPLNIPDDEVNTNEDVSEFFRNYVEESNTNEDVTEIFRNYVEEFTNQDVVELNEAMSKHSKILSASNMSNISDDYSVITSNEPPNIILDGLTPCELVFYNAMIKYNISSFTIKYRRNTYCKETVVISMLPPLSELKYFNGKNVKIQLVAIDELGSCYTTCQQYIDNHDGDFYEHHTFCNLNDSKKEICDDIKKAYKK